MNRESSMVFSAQLFSQIEPLLKEGNFAAFNVSGMSMWPFICHKRDSVILKEAEIASLKVGDIVLLKVPIYEKYLLHRITRIDFNRQRFQTAGDGNCFYDGWFPLESIVAVVTSIIYKGKEISTSDIKQRVLSTLWRRTFPIRPALLYILNKISYMKNRMCKS